METIKDVQKRLGLTDEQLLRFLSKMMDEVFPDQIKDFAELCQHELE